MLNKQKTGKEAISGLTQRITFYEYLYVFVLIIYAGLGNRFFNSSSLTENTIGVFLPIVLSVILALRWKIDIDAHFYLMMLGFTIYFVAVSLKYREIQPTFLLVYFFIFFTVYSTVKALGINLFKIYEKLLYFLAIIGLIFWIAQTALGGDNLYYMLKGIPGIDLFSNVSGDGLNAILYSVQPTYTSLRYNFTLPRNCGYAWEPGAFAVYLCLAIFINLFFTNSDKNSKKRFWVLLTALLSSQSTTGYIIFIVIILFYFLNKKLYIVLLLFPFAIISLIYISTLPFMSQKVIELIDETKGIDLLVERTIGREEEVTPQRFTSFMITFTDFRNNPVLGLGNHQEESWTNKIGANISSITGIGNLLSQFGLVGFLFFIIVSFQSSVFFSKYFNYKGNFLLFLIILFISISYSILLLPIVMCFWMFQIFEPKKATQKEKEGIALNSNNLAPSPEKL
jgi:hypothetical protein